MDKLRKKIIIYFILCVLAMSFVSGVVYGFIEIALLPAEMMVELTTPVYDTLYEQLGVKTIGLFVLSSLLMDAILIVVSAILFWIFTKNAVNAESKRQISERNMQYSSICHDLKTPMTSVQGFAAALREGRIKEEEKQEIFDIIYDKSVYMNELVESMFTYSKLNTESYNFTFEEADICSLVRNLVAINYDEFEAKDIDLEINIPEDDIICKVDEKELKRGISNLLINSCKHNRNGAKVMVEVKKHKNSVYITVADDGKPISKEDAKNIVKPFVSGNEARTSKSGSGLGLAITSIIVGKHKGKLYVDSNIQGYTKGFVVKLPLRK